MQSIDFYNDYKFCPSCNVYVSYLMSIQASYCTKCGGEVSLFSKEDWEEFNHGKPAAKVKKSPPQKRAIGFGRS